MTSNKLKFLYLGIEALTFLTLNISCFFYFIYPFLPTGSEQQHAKSIEVDKYLPFDENSLIVNKKDTLEMEGKKPIIDCATALYPVASAFVNSLYDKEDVKYSDMKFESDSCLQLNNTVGAYKAIADGTSDIGLLAKPSQAQLDYAASKGVELVLEPIGYESFVFLVHKDNPVENLTIEQVKQIYAGDTTNWKDVGGKNKKIVPLQRAENSGSQTTFLNFMGETKPEENGTFYRFGSAIGYSFRFYVEGVVKNGNVKMIGLEGVYPNKENIINKTYPIVSTLYAVYSNKNTNPNVPKLVDWIKNSAVAQQIIDETGYVSLNS